MILAQCFNEIFGLGLLHLIIASRIQVDIVFAPLDQPEFYFGCFGLLILVFIYSVSRYDDRKLRCDSIFLMQADFSFIRCQSLPLIRII